MGEVMNWIIAEGTGHYFFIAFPVCLVILFVLLRGRRASFAIPSLLMTLVIVNPWVYRKWDSLGLYAYWRILWIVPVIPVVASIIPAIVERIEAGAAASGSDNAQDSKSNRGTGVVMALTVVVGIGLVAFGGTFLYNGAGGSFVKAENAAKEPDFAVEIADTLLEHDENPRVVFQHPIGTYVRQYTGEIDQLFGRNIDGFILRASKEASTVNGILNDPGADLSSVAALMANDTYEYLVVNNADREAALDDAGFILIDEVEDFGIYEAHGVPALIKERNNLGQVISTTTVDKNGKPINGEAGFAKVSWEYDKNGFIKRERRTDVDGNGVADSNGSAGYERVCDENGRILMERFIDPEGLPVDNIPGYAEYRRIYQGPDLIEESYYTAGGQLTDRIDTRYAIIRMTYDDDHNRISEVYYNKANEVVLSSAGYAKVVHTYDEKRMVSESYFGIDEQPVSIALGYSSKKRTYDSAGNVILECYFDEGGLATNTVNGYAVDERQYDAEGNIIFQRFLDADNKPVVTGSGYAEVHRIYDGKCLIREEYYGSDGNPYLQPAGYCAIEQEWMEDTLVSRTYLGPDGQPVNRTDGYSKAVWEAGKNCTNLHCYNIDGAEVEISTLNLARDVKVNADGWSDWLMPRYNTVNSCQNIGYTNLGPKADGDVYTCTVELEFKDVTATEGHTLRFWAQGAQDGKWFTGNVWFDNVVDLSEAPKDGIYKYTSTIGISGDMIDISTFDMGFRCDYWNSGMYRVRLAKIEKNDTGTEWSPGL